MAKRPYLTRRAGIWHYVRRVPDRLAHVDGRVIVRMLTGIRIADGPRGIKAAAAVRALDNETERLWRETLAGRANEAHAAYDAARRTARRHGFDYAPVAELSLRPIDEIVRRLEALVHPGFYGRDLAAECQRETVTARALDLRRIAALAREARREPGGPSMSRCPAPPSLRLRCASC